MARAILARTTNTRTIMQHRKIAFIGAGNMTRSIVSGLVNNAYPAKLITASNPSMGKLSALQADFAINVTQDNHVAVNAADVIVLAVKPQLMEQVCAKLAEDSNLGNKLFVSIAAGITTARLQQMLGGSFPIVRTMPNTPSALGKGMTGLFADIDVNEIDKQYSAEAKTAMFNTTSIQKELFSVQFFEDSSTPVGLKSAFIKEMYETAIQVQPSMEHWAGTLAEFGVNYTFTNSQFWKEGKTAPAYYYDFSDINSTISEYMTGPDSTSYVSYEDEIIEKNDDRQSLKVIAPPYIDAFARDYKRLLNE